MQFKLRVVGHVDEIGIDKRSDLFKEQTPTSEIKSLLNVPMRELSEPIAVNSSILSETIFLCPNEETANQVETNGGVAYTPEEIAALLRASKDMEQGEWVSFLKSLHMTKKTFGGSRIRVSHLLKS